MTFTIVGFKDDTGLRVFTFDGIASDRSRSTFQISADLSLARRHGIAMQELPLLCREVLERRAENGETRALTFSEADMLLHAGARAAARDHAAARAKGVRRPPAPGASSPWRTAPRIGNPILEAKVETDSGSKK